MARVIFVAAIILNVLLWSNGRFAQSVTAKYHGESSLVRRISYEFMHPREVGLSQDNVSRPPYTMQSNLEGAVSSVIQAVYNLRSSVRMSRNIVLALILSCPWIIYIITSVQTTCFDHFYSPLWFRGFSFCFQLSA